MPTPRAQPPRVPICCQPSPSREENTLIQHRRGVLPVISEPAHTKDGAQRRARSRETGPMQGAEERQATSCQFPHFQRTLVEESPGSSATQTSHSSACRDPKLIDPSVEMCEGSTADSLTTPAGGTVMIPPLRCRGEAAHVEYYSVDMGAAGMAAAGKSSSSNQHPLQGPISHMEKELVSKLMGIEEKLVGLELQVNGGFDNLQVLLCGAAQRRNKSGRASPRSTKRFGEERGAHATSSDVAPTWSLFGEEMQNHIRHTYKHVDERNTRITTHTVGSAVASNTPRTTAAGSAVATREQEYNMSQISMSGDESRQVASCGEGTCGEAAEEGGRRSQRDAPTTMFKLSGRAPMAWQRRLWSVLEDPQSGSLAWWYSQLWSPLIILSVLLSLSQTVGEGPVIEHQEAVRALEWGFDAMFFVESLLRMSCSTSMRGYLFNIWNVIDILSFCTVPLRMNYGLPSKLSSEASHQRKVMLCYVPILRYLKSFRHFQKFHLFVKVIQYTIDALRVLLFTLVVIVLFYSAMIYTVEPRENIATLSEAMWLTIVTMTTVGYGDKTPSTTPGTVITSCIILSSVLYMAMPIGIVGSAFTQVWLDRDRILLTLMTRKRLIQWGFTPNELELLFSHWDKNNDGEIDLKEFKMLCEEMRLGLSNERVIELFESFDRDNSGGVNAKELIRELFPGSHFEMMSKISKSGGSVYHGARGTLMSAAGRRSDPSRPV